MRRAKKSWIALGMVACALAWPAFAQAQQPWDEYPGSGWWLGVGLGAGQVRSMEPAPSAGRGSVAGSIDVGYRFNPRWGLGMEFGVVAPVSGCHQRGCTPASPGFAPDFTRWFLVGEHRMPGTGLRLRFGAGLSSMCYRYYETRQSGWSEFLEFLLFEDEPSGDETVITCDRLRAFGASASIGYQWRLVRGAPVSLGMQLRGEVANFAASRVAGTPPFKHRAVMLQLQLNLN